MLRAVHAAALVAVVVGLAGCSAGNEAEARPTHPGPLEAYFSTLIATDVETRLAVEISIQERIAECMAEKGFAYEPQRPTMEEESEEQPGTRDFAERYGYGYFSYPLPPPRASDTEEPPDWFAAMSDTEREAFWEAMNGPNPEVTKTLETGGEVDFEVWGCNGHWVDYYENGGGRKDPVYRAASEHLQLIDASLLDQDPRVQEADAAWSECMADAGWPGLRTQRAAADSVRAWHDGAIDPETHVVVPPDSSTVEEEKQLALADWDCGVSTNYHQIRAGVRDELQQTYVDAHREELEGWLATWGQ